MTAKKTGGSEGEGHVVAVNKKARREYEILDTFEAGLQLLGSEVKSVREGAINLRESYIRLKNGEAFLVGCHISPYKYSRENEHDPLREKKLLLHRREIERLASQTQMKGLTIVPLKVYFTGQGRAKAAIGVGRGKKLYDKREDIKSREAAREIERVMKRR